MKKKSSKILCLLLSVALFLCVLPVMSVLADDEALVLDVSQGSIRVYTDGYVIDGSEKVSYTGNYILTGLGHEEIYFESSDNGGSAVYNVTVRDLFMPMNIAALLISVQG